MSITERLIARLPWLGRVFALSWSGWMLMEVLRDQGERHRLGPPLLHIPGWKRRRRGQWHSGRPLGVRLCHGGNSVGEFPHHPRRWERPRREQRRLREQAERRRLGPSVLYLPGGIRVGQWHSGRRPRQRLCHGLVRLL